jgi:hypothetical protein
MEIPDARRLKQLEEENRQLKRIVADQALNLVVVKDLLGKKWWRARHNAVALAECPRKSGDR